MEKIFLQFVNNSLVASWLILTVLLLRPVLKRVPKWTKTLMWSIVAIRLIFPFSIESTLSLIPSAKPLPEDFVTTSHPHIASGIPAVDKIVNPVVTLSLNVSDTAENVNPTQLISYIFARIWIVGILVMVTYAVMSTIVLKRRLRTATLYEKGIKQSEKVQSPFVLGVFRPVIYIPYRLDEKALKYVIEHEKAHIQRRDYIWKPLGFLLLSVYWFHPLVWVGYVFLCKDIEAACDERVIREMDVEGRRAYSAALLECSVKKRMITACPVAFGENGVKTRIKDVMNYKKPAFWVIIFSVIICILIAVCFLTVPKEDEKNAEPVVSEENSGNADEPEDGGEAGNAPTETEEGDYETGTEASSDSESSPENGTSDGEQFTNTEKQLRIILPKEMREALGINLFLPTNIDNIKDPVLESEHSASISFYDKILKEECTLSVSKQDEPWQWKRKLGLSENWEGWTKDNVHVPITLSKSEGGLQFYCTWNYEDYWFSIYGNVPDAEANKDVLWDIESVPKIAIFIIQNLSVYQDEDDLSSSFRWGDKRDWMCGTIDKISTAGSLGISQKLFVSEEDMELREKLGLTDEDFLDGYHIVSEDSISEVVDYPFASDCEFVFVDWHRTFEQDERVVKKLENGWHVSTTDYFVFYEYLAEYSSLDNQVFFFDIRDGMIVSVYETPLP